MEKKMNARKKAQRAARLRKQRNRRIALTLCLMFVVAFASIGGTIAWLTANSGPVVNTFTAGDINITLAETTGKNYKVVPGVDITKDPVATVLANSEACYLFVKIDKDNWNDKMSYTLASGWKTIEGVNNVYYREVGASENDQPFQILASDTVFVSGELTETECEAMKTNKPTLTFTAYACQQAGRTVTEAWDVVKPTT